MIKKYLELSPRKPDDPASRTTGVSHNAAQHGVHPTGGTLRDFRQFAWLEVGSVKVVLSRPTHQRVTHTVRRPTQYRHESDKPLSVRPRI
jgi:hypothetical protein